MNAKGNVLPFTAFEQLPVEFSYKIDPKTRRVDLIISTSEQFAPLLMDGLQVLTQVAQQSRRFIEAADREKRTEDFLAEHRQKEDRIRAAYWNLRNNGLKQRAAIYVLLEDESMPYHGLWNFSDYSKCVKGAPRPSPILRKVPTHTPKPQKVTP